MSSACSMGRTAFAEQVKELRVDSPVRTLSRIRIERAKHLLRETNLSITEIAGQCGFSSSQRFATVFKKFSDMSPRHYRASAK